MTPARCQVEGPESIGDPGKLTFLVASGQFPSDLDDMRRPGPLLDDEVALVPVFEVVYLHIPAEQLYGHQILKYPPPVFPPPFSTESAA